MAAMLAGFGVYILGIVGASIGKTSTVSRGPGLVAGLAMLLFAIPFAARIRTRLEATSAGLTFVNSYRTRTIPWSEIKSFRRGRPGGFSAPYMRFGDGLYAQLTDGTEILLAITMARQPYRDQKDLDERLTALQSWVTQR